MPKIGQAKVFSNRELYRVLREIEHHRHPAKNTLIIQISFKLGLRVQEMALLRVREMVDLSQKHQGGYVVKGFLALPRSFTKDARAVAAGVNQTRERTSVKFTIAEFDRIVADVADKARNNESVNAADYYPPITKLGAMVRELPLVDHDLLVAISRYMDERMAFNKHLKPDEPLLMSQ